MANKCGFGSIVCTCLWTQQTTAVAILWRLPESTHFFSSACCCLCLVFCMRQPTSACENSLCYRWCVPQWLCPTNKWVCNYNAQFDKGLHCRYFWCKLAYIAFCDMLLAVKIWPAKIFVMLFHDLWSPYWSMKTVASFPAVICSAEKWEEPGIFSHVTMT